MIAPRRFLPSVNSLLALEAVDRLGSATLAAGELSLTHSAISRQLKHLEGQIGVTLFDRAGRALVLTPAGRDYAATARGYLQDLARASLKIRAAGARRDVPGLAPDGPDAVVAAFGRALAGKHAAVVREALDILRRRFADEEATEGYRKDGPVSVAKFELGEGPDAELREARVLRQRQASDLIDRLLAGIG